MSNDRATPLSELLGNNQPNGQPQQQMSPEEAQQRQMMAQQQMQAQLRDQQILAQQQMQAQHEEEAKKSEKKGFMDSVRDIDYKSAILVFSVILILTTSVFTGFMRTYINGAVGPDNRMNLMGSFITALLGMIIFLIIKFAAKF